LRQDVIGRVSFANCDPLFHDLAGHWRILPAPPSWLTGHLMRGECLIAPIPLADFVKNIDTLQAIDSIGIASDGGVGSVLLFGDRPIEEMRDIALKYNPNAVCLVPENRLELTTEGGLNVVSNRRFLSEYIRPLRDSGVKVSIFLAPDKEQIDAALDVGATTVELHTGMFCDLHYENKFEEKTAEFEKLKQMATYASSLGIEVHAGHGLTLETVGKIAGISEIEELNIGHALISEAIFCGLELAIKNMRKQMDKSRLSK